MVYFMENTIEVDDLGSWKLCGRTGGFARKINIDPGKPAAEVSQT